MGGQGGLVEVGPGARLGVEVVVLVGASHEDGRVTHLGLAHVGRDVADGQADASVVAAVGVRTVHELDVMQGHLAGLQGQSHSLALVDVDRDLLAARQQVVLVEGVHVGQLIDLVAAGNHLHIAALFGHVGQCDPGRDHFVRVQAPIGGVLVPGDEARTVGFLDEEVGVPAEDVRADGILDGVEHLRVMHQRIGPGEQQVHLVPQVALQGLSQLPLVGL